jgi:ribosomal protein L40E
MEKLYPEKAVWLHRKYQRHSVERDVKHFCGWQILLKCLGIAKDQDEKNLIAFTFETGGRISEVLQLKTTMFNVVKDAKPPILVVQGMPLVKQYEKESEHLECLKCHTLNPKGISTCQKCGENLLMNGKKRFKTRLLVESRNEFVIRCDEPLCRVMLPELLQHMKKNQPLIFRDPKTGKSRNRRWAYRVLRKIGDKAGIYLYPHRLRSERACHLGNSPKAESLLEWFAWEHWNTAKRYSKKGAFGLAQELGVDVKATQIQPP